MLDLAGFLSKALRDAPSVREQVSFVAPDLEGEAEVSVSIAPVCVTASIPAPPEIPADQPLPSLGSDVASVQEKSGFRRLHRVGECSFRPGIHYGHFVCFGGVMPAVSDFHARCKWCCPQPAAVGADDPETATSSGSSSDQSSIE